MEQEHLRKKIIKYTAVLVLISAVILVSSSIVVVAVRKAEERSYTAYVDSLVNEYRLRFQEQMSTDFEMLQILEALMEKGLLSREMVIADQGRDLAPNFSFYKVGYYAAGAEEHELHLPGSDRPYAFSSRPAEAQEAIRSAWSGENAVSQVYEENGARVVTYAIPVYQGDVVKGALTGRRSSERRSAGRGLPIRFTALLWETTDGI